MDKFKLRMTGKTDARGKRVFYCLCNMPVMLDLNDCVINFFEDKDGKGGELVVRHFEVDENGDSKP